MSRLLRPKIHLISMDGYFFRVDTEVLKISPFLIQLLEDIDLDDKEDDHSHPVPIMIPGDTLKKLLEWMQYEYNRRPVGHIDGTVTTVPNIALDENFWKIDLEHLNALAKAASDFGLDGLLDAACTLIENKLYGQLDIGILNRIFASILRRD